jgi:hypothetical protein
MQSYHGETEDSKKNGHYANAVHVQNTGITNEDRGELKRQMKGKY